MKRNSFLANHWPIRLQHGPVKTLNFFPHPPSTLCFKNHVQKSVMIQLYRTVDDDWKLKLSHSTHNTAQLLKILKSSKDANKTMKSIQNFITNRKRDKQVYHPKTTLTLDSGKGKTNFKKNTESKNKKLSQAWGRLQNKTPKLQNSNKKITSKRKRNKVYENYPRTQQKQR